MIRISVEVSSSDACFEASVRADSIEQAMNLVNARYHGAKVRVRFPIDPETFFVEDPAAGPPILLTMPQEQAS